jgi:hypothetical protein
MFSKSSIHCLAIHPKDWISIKVYLLHRYTNKVPLVEE